MGAGGLEPPRARVRAGCSAARTPHPDSWTQIFCNEVLSSPRMNEVLVPSVGFEPTLRPIKSRGSYRLDDEGRSRPFAALFHARPPFSKFLAEMVRIERTPRRSGPALSRRGGTPSAFISGWRRAEVLIPMHGWSTHHPLSKRRRAPARLTLLVRTPGPSPGFPPYESGVLLYR